MGSVLKRLFFEKELDVMASAVTLTFFFCMGLVLVGQALDLPTTVLAAIPDVGTARISPDPVYTNQDLLGWCNATDDDGDDVRYYYRWYKNDVLNVSTCEIGAEIITEVTTSDASECIGTWDATQTCLLVNDSNYDTYGIAAVDNEAEFRVNYTKPYGVNGAFWETKYGNSSDTITINNTIPSDCLDQNPLQLLAESYNEAGVSFNDRVRFFCHAGDSWEVVTSIYIKDRIYEEKLFWNTSSAGIHTQGTEVNVHNLTSANTTGGENWTFSCLGNDGTDNATSWINDSVILGTSNVAPTQPTVTITPASPTVSQDLTCTVTTASTDGNGDDISYYYNWYNGSTLNLTTTNLSATSHVLKAANTTTGDVWRCSAIPHDGTVNGTISANSSVTIVADPTGDGDDDGGGGGGGGAVVNEHEFSIDLISDKTVRFGNKGGQVSIKTTIENTGDYIEYDIAVSIDECPIDAECTSTAIERLSKGESKEVTLYIDIPADFWGDEFTITVEASNDYHTDTSSFNLFIETRCQYTSECRRGYDCINEVCVQLFDIKILNLAPTANIGEITWFGYLMKSMSDTGVDVVINFLIEKDNETVTLGSDTLFVDAGEEKEEDANVLILNGLEPGIYDFSVELDYGSNTAISTRAIELVRKGIIQEIIEDMIEEILDPETDTPWGIFVVIAILVIVASLIWYYKYRKKKSGKKTKKPTKKRKRKKKPVKKSKKKTKKRRKKRKKKSRK